MVNIQNLTIKARIALVALCAATTIVLTVLISYMALESSRVPCS